MTIKKSLLATDLDGTLIPSHGSESSSRERLALRHISRSVERGELGLIFVTGRHYTSVLEAIESFELPRPEQIICDVGSTIMTLHNQRYLIESAYVNHLASLTHGRGCRDVANILTSIRSIRLQEDEKQSLYKLSYYCHATHLRDSTETILRLLRDRALPFGCVDSIDPFTGDGLIDILPVGVDKSYALRWWLQRNPNGTDPIAFAGDSGNDYAALTSGLNSIVVANMDRELANRIEEHHRSAGTLERVYFTSEPATSGVLEGCWHFGLVANDRL